MRSKEDAMDYRYFPEPDLPSLVIAKEYISDRNIDELPMDRRLRYLEQYHLVADDARILSADRVTSDFYEELVRITADPKKSCSYITTILFGIFQASSEKVGMSDLRFSASDFAKVISLVNADELSSTNSKLVIEEMYQNGGNPDEIVDRLGVRQKNDAAFLESIVNAVIAENPTQVAEYQAGKTNLFGYLVGSCMKKSA